MNELLLTVAASTGDETIYVAIAAVVAAVLLFVLKKFKPKKK